MITANNHSLDLLIEAQINSVQLPSVSPAFQDPDSSFSTADGPIPSYAFDLSSPLDALFLEEKKAGFYPSLMDTEHLEMLNNFMYTPIPDNLGPAVRKSWKSLKEVTLPDYMKTQFIPHVSPAKCVFTKLINYW